MVLWLGQNLEIKSVALQLLYQSRLCECCTRRITTSPRNNELRSCRPWLWKSYFDGSLSVSERMTIADKVRAVQVAPYPGLRPLTFPTMTLVGGPSNSWSGSESRSGQPSPRSVIENTVPLIFFSEGPSCENIPNEKSFGCCIKAKQDWKWRNSWIARLPSREDQQCSWSSKTS